MQNLTHIDDNAYRVELTQEEMELIITALIHESNRRDLPLRLRATSDGLVQELIATLR